MANAKPREPWVWSPARVEALEKAIADGQSAGQFEQSTGGQCTRNAALGKAFRLGLSFNGEVRNLRAMRKARERRSPKPPRQVKSAAPKPVYRKPPPRPRLPQDPGPRSRTALPTLRVVQTEGRFLGLLERRDFGQCKYIVNDPPEGAAHLSVYCAADSGCDAYCPAHRALCWKLAPQGQRAFDAAAKYGPRV